MYAGQCRYRVPWRPRRHFLGSDDVPAFDGTDNSEEFQCAQAIDSLPGLKFWLRNVASHPNSFWLPTATGKFYPDFVAELEDGRRLVVEYKGAHIADSADTAEKRTIGQLWEQRSEGKGRSEEHTSELQSLMRSSYAVFCLKNKNINTRHNRTNLQNRHENTK